MRDKLERRLPGGGVRYKAGQNRTVSLGEDCLDPRSLRAFRSVEVFLRLIRLRPVCRADGPSEALLG
jgi:hypothetical protein